MVRGSRLLVLGWHNVDPTHCFPAPPGSGRRGLESQLRLVSRIGNVVPLASALRDLAEGRPLPPRAVAITFDDGYRDNLTIAGPMLRRLGLPATCFLVTGLLSGTSEPWWEKLGWVFDRARAPRMRWEDLDLPTGDDGARRRAFDVVSERVKRRDRLARDAAVAELVEVLEPGGTYELRRDFLDWDEARRLGEYMELGSHTSYHAILAHETAHAQRADLAASRRELGERLGTDARVLAYPNGTAADYDADTLDAVEAAGYDHAVTTERGANGPATPRFEIHRWVMNPDRGVVDLGKFVRHPGLLRTV